MKVYKYIMVIATLFFSGSVVAQFTFYRDFDGDGHGNANSSIYGSYPPPGYVSNNNDCNDNNDTIGAPQTWYRDADGDGLGNPNISTVNCSGPYGYVSNNDDYDDTDNDITNVPPNTFYLDSDGDGWGTGTPITASYPQGQYTATNGGDCNDSDYYINPNGSEICGDGKDNNCNGSTDENNPVAPSYITTGGGCGYATVTRADPPSGITYYWQNGSTGTSTANSQKTRTFTSGSNVFIFLRARNSQGCWGPPVQNTYSVQQPGPAPSAPSANTSVCGQVTLTRPDPNVIYTYYWQSSPTGTSTSNSNKNLTLTSGTVYYLRSKQTNGPCWSDYAEVTFSINQGTTWYLDADNDGHAVAGGTIQSCTNPGTGYTTTQLPEDDCDDSNGLLTGLRIWYEDADNDGLGDPTTPSGLLCSAPAGYVGNNGDNCPAFTDTTNHCDSGDDDEPDLGVDPEVSLTISGTNYVYTRTYQEDGYTDGNVPAFFSANEDLVQEITYVDGLGRPIQQIGIDQSPNKDHIVTHMGYDDYGRMEKEWLPLVDQDQQVGYGYFRTNDMELATNSFYQNKYPQDFPTQVNPYSQKEFDPSPLNRVLRQAAPGEDWKLGGGHEIEFVYETNTAADNVRQFEVHLLENGNTYTPSLIENSVNLEYSAGELYKTVTKDENHIDGNDHTTEEFTNKQGQVILKRTYESNQRHDTYYIYDDHGNLSFVLPPKMEASTESLANINANMNELGYRYVYDHRNRLVEKQLPGKDKEYIIYNKADQPIMTQDANQRAIGEWLFTKYDAFGRVAYTGKAVDNRDRPGIQEEVDAQTGPTSVAKEDSFSMEGITVGYANTGYPTATVTEVLTVNYYDGYSFGPTTGANVTVFGLASTERVRGLATGSRVKVLDVSPAQWITTATYYDDKARPIYTYSENEYLNTVDIVESQLDFVGRLQQLRTEHTRNSETVVTLDNFTYDHVGRLLKQTQCIGNESLGYTCPGNAQGVTANLVINGQTVATDQVASNSIIVTNSTITNGTLSIVPNTGIAELIVENSYDELGQLESKNVGGAADAATPLQIVDYTYNVRGWLTGINDVTDTTPDKLFNFGISYNSGATPLYNGNISATQWRTDNQDKGLKSYSYTYDALNRITGATDDTAKFNISGITYDKNGNIETLKREGWTSASPSLANNTGFGTMDDLVYDYDSGNKLTNVADNNASDSYGFVDVNGSGTEYTYDANGNMTRDDNKGITSITYNHLNLPQQVSFGGNNIQYVYAADGTKLKKTVSTTGTETLYAGGYLYEGNTLQFFPHPEGYVSVENGSYKYVYEFKDHLSNTRLSYTDADDNGNIAQNEIIKESNYFPFGLAHRGYNGGISPLGNSVAKKYMFGGKEYQDELDLGWYDVSARNYDPALGRWMNLDPLTEQMRRHSPYNYAFDNPVFFIDPDGMKPCPNGDCENGFLAALRGYYKGARNAVQKRVDAVVGFVSDPVGSIETAVENTPSTFEEAAEATVTQIVGDTSIGDLALTTLDIVQGAQENGIEGAVEAAAENLADRSIDAALALTPIKMKTKTAAPKTTKNAPVTNQLYKRPNNATTPAQRASVQNKPCVDCGGTSPTMRADHKTPLVEEHYTTGTINKTKMRSTEAVQPQCETCSNSQGGKMSAYSKQMKKIIEERTKNQ